MLVASNVPAGAGGEVLAETLAELVVEVETLPNRAELEANLKS